MLLLPTMFSALCGRRLSVYNTLLASDNVLAGGRRGDHRGTEVLHSVCESHFVFGKMECLRSLVPQQT